MALTVLGYAVSAAESQPRGGPCRPYGMLPLRQLDLTDLQRDQIQAVREQNADAVRAISEQIRAARKAVEEAVTSDVVNEGSIRSLAADLATLGGDAAVQRAYLYAQMWQLLTPDQQVHATELNAEMEARREDQQLWMERRRGKRRGAR